MNFIEKAVIMNAGEMTRAIKRMAHEIVEANKGVDNLVLLGVQRRGVPLAGMLAEAIKQVEGTRGAPGRPGHHLLPRRPVQARARRPRCPPPRCPST